jgi:hypothetical protein
LRNKSGERDESILIKLLEQFLKISFVYVLCRLFEVRKEKLDDFESLFYGLPKEIVEKSHMQDVSSLIITLRNIDSKLFVLSSVH